MKSKAFRTIVGVVLLYFNIFGVYGDSEEEIEEAQPNYEYIQIFKSIPALFEYLLDALEERPEILEKNDVTMFKRNIDIPDLEECENSEHDKKTEKRDTKCDVNKKGSVSVNKRDTDTSKEVSETTVAYEYGNSNIVMKGVDEIESNKVMSKRFVNADINKFPDKTMKNKILNNENRINGRFKSDAVSKLNDDTNDLFRNYGEVFFGFEHLFGLDLKPEEIEERILEAEKLLEEHNNKKNEK